MNTAFDGCGLPQVVPIPDAGWTDDVSVPEAPQTIAECPTVPAPLPEPEASCPTIAVGTFDVGLDRGGRGSVSLEIVRGECCSFEIGGEFVCPCVQLPQLTVAQTEQVGPGEGYARLTVTRQASGEDPLPCSFDLSLEFGFPPGLPTGECLLSLPAVTAASTTLVPAASVAAALDILFDPDPEICAVAFDLAFDFAEPVCPTFDTSGVSASLVPGGSGSSNLSVSQPDPDACEFFVGWALEVPCSDFPAGAIAASTEFVSPRYSYLSLTVVPTTGCSFDVDLAAGFPCPQLIGETGSTTVGGPPSVGLTVSEEPYCTNRVRVDMDFPCPQYAFEASATIHACQSPQVPESRFYGIGEPLPAPLWTDQGLPGCRPGIGLDLHVRESCLGSFDPVRGSLTELGVLSALDMTWDPTTCTLCLTSELTVLNFVSDRHTSIVYEILDAGTIELPESCVETADCLCAPQCPQAVVISTPCCEIPETLTLTISNISSGAGNCSYLPDPWVVTLTYYGEFPSGTFLWTAEVVPDGTDPNCSGDLGDCDRCSCLYEFEFGCKTVAEEPVTFLTVRVNDENRGACDGNPYVFCDNGSMLQTPDEQTIVEFTCDPFSASAPGLEFPGSCAWDAEIS